jgi:CheY-like chemotaxis protein
LQELVIPPSILDSLGEVRIALAATGHARGNAHERRGLAARDCGAPSDLNVLTTANGQDDLRQARAYKSDIHLLLTDFEMPGISGIDLATNVTPRKTANTGANDVWFNGGMLVLNEGWHFLLKPFIPSQLGTLIVGPVALGGKSKF